MSSIHLAFDGSQSCFLRCSSATFNATASRGPKHCAIVSLHCNDNPQLLLFGLKVEEQLSDRNVVLNKTLADSLGLKEGLAELNSVQHTAPAIGVTVQCSPDSYSLVVLHRQQIEEQLLNQVKVIQKSKPVLVWLSPSNCIKFIVSEIDPPEATSLNEFTKLAIAEETSRSRSVTEKCSKVLLSKIVFSMDETVGQLSLPEVTISCFCERSVPVQSHGLLCKVAQPTKDSFLCMVRHCKNCLRSVTLAASSLLSSFFAQNEVVVLQFPVVSVLRPLLGFKCPVFEDSSLSDYSVVQEDESGVVKHVVAAKEGQLEVKKSTVVPTPPVSPVNPHSLVYERIIDHLLHSLPFSSKSLTLLTSAVACHGAGKTHLCKLLLAEPRLRNFFISYQDATQLRGKRLENILREVGELLAHCSFNQPSLLVLDNLDAVLPARSKNEDASGDELFGTRLATRLAGEFARYTDCNVEILLTTQTEDSCHGRVQEVCEEVFTLPLLPAGQQMPLLRALLPAGDNDVETLLAGVSLKSNLTVGEVVKLARSLRGGRLPEVCRFLELEKKKAATEHVGLADCGALHAAKEELHRMLVLPFRHPDLFAQIPFQLNRGLLLFGPPGVGKTHLVRAMATDLDMGFVTVKGPELLSKYIGASEDAVRGLFRRAREASPCLLFFDEFDSLAPCRGNDTTGVMDRVVNQMLTELDGLGQREGVFVVAATSRPDTLDPALLRPGRLGRRVFCPMPGPSDRAEIWAALLRSCSVESSVSTPLLAAETAFFSGADMRAALYNAQLALVRSGRGAGTSLGQADLIAAIRETKPSLRKDDLSNYETIYDKFLSGNVTNVGYKTTLR